MAKAHVLRRGGRHLAPSVLAHTGGAYDTVHASGQRRSHVLLDRGRNGEVDENARPGSAQGGGQVAGHRDRTARAVVDGGAAARVHSGCHAHAVSRGHGAHDLASHATRGSRDYDLDHDVRHLLRRGCQRGKSLSMSLSGWGPTKASVRGPPSVARATRWTSSRETAP